MPAVATWNLCNKDDAARVTVERISRCQPTIHFQYNPNDIIAT